MAATSPDFPSARPPLAAAAAPATTTTSPTAVERSECAGHVGDHAWNTSGRPSLQLRSAPAEAIPSGVRRAPACCRPPGHGTHRAGAARTEPDSPPVLRC
ncbi:hypothetical protein ACTVZO_05895 [Streptomyces sp. IBSNAI002]|uniref:hypothetical protein n=1 Tax=Streptomyces sp. IBSNAI002 TaxID=3457500 RepID=UPI003FD38771